MDTQKSCPVCANNLKIQQNTLEISQYQDGVLPLLWAVQLCSVGTCQGTSAKWRRGSLKFVGTLVPLPWERAGLARLLSFVCFWGKAKHLGMETPGEEIDFLFLPSRSSRAQLSSTL